MIAGGIMRIDRKWLEDHGACDEDVDLFAASFPGGAELNRANLLIAERSGFNLMWLAETILSPGAMRAYREAVAAAWRAYCDARARAMAPARRAYHEARATAMADAMGLD